MVRGDGGTRTLHDALRLPPWVFPFDGSEDKPIYPLDAQSETTGELWRELERATGCSDTVASTTSASVS